MDSLTPPQTQADYLCRTCGAWVRNGKTLCQWCGTPAPSNDLESAEVAYSLDASSALLGEDDTTQSVIEWTRVPPKGNDPLRYSPGHSWRRTFAWTFLLVLLLVGSAAGLGIYQGLNDRQVQSKRQAIEYFNQGRDFMEGEKYELAAAAFREALRLEPNFEAAAQLLALAEHNAEVQAGLTLESPPTPKPSDSERLFAEAQAALRRGDWEIAAATFDLLSTQFPGFQSEAVAEGLFSAQVEAGRSALERGDLDKALSHFDHALTVEPENMEVLRQRKATSAYRAGLSAFQKEEWEKAANQFRIVYLIDPAFLDTTALLAQAHLELGKEFEARTIWCQAAQQYRSSAAVVENKQVSQLAEVAENRCDTRVVVSPPRAATAAPPTRAPFPTRTPEEDEENNNEATPLPSETPLVEETPLPTSTPVPTGPVGYQLVGGVGESFDEGCGGHYIRGIVRAVDGAPLAGVTVLAIDQYGNYLSTISKSDPLGQYNIPIPAQFISYEVVVVAGETRLSTPIVIQHAERFVQSAQACHILNWQQVP